MDAIRAFELKQMNYSITCCSVCSERKIDMKLSANGVCRRCSSDKAMFKMYSKENNMDPGEQPDELKGLTIVEQQLICRISPTINVHMLKHGGIASNGHCVTFPQEINEPCKIFPRLPSEINIIKVRKQGQNDSSKEFRVRRYSVQTALQWLKSNNPAYSDIEISSERLALLPIEGEISNIPTVDFKPDTAHTEDHGPAPNQLPTGDNEGESISSVLLPDANVDIRQQIEDVVRDVVGENAEVTMNRRNTFTIPWPTRDNIPVSEFTTHYFFTLAFPCLFPTGSADFLC